MATLTVTHTESLVLNGKDLGSNNVFNITDVDMSYSRLMKTVASQDNTLVIFRAAENIADSAISVAEAKYIRVTNLDTTNSVTLSLQISADEDGAPDDSTSILLAAGESFVMGTPHDAIATDSTGAGVITTLVDLESIIAHSGSNTVSLEVFVAGTEG
tara:strand:+ start:233 stop:706 length:474 start_codon:yes stop_codon:yes gene_type:complete